MCDVCDGRTGDQVRREFLARIAEHDYTMVNVREERARDRSWVAPGFVYSVGLWTFRRAPELIVVGAPVRHAVALVERYAEQSLAGRRFAPGGPYPDFLPDVGMMLEVVAPALYHQWLVSAFDFYPDGGFPAYQLIWPDRDGVWPWEGRWSRRHPPQPVLTESGRPESWAIETARGRPPIRSKENPRTQ